MKDFTLRKMIKADLPVVTTIESDCQSHPWSLLQFLDGLNAGHEGWVACAVLEGEETIIGFAVVSRVVDEATLLNLCVRPAYQNRGVGKRILRMLLDMAGKQGVVKTFLEVRASNKGAIRLYESLGFEQVAVRRDYYPALVGREDGVVYSLSPVSD